MFPYGKAGLYGGGMGKAGPYGSTLMQPGSQRLMTAPPVRQEPPYDARQAMRDVRDISQMPKTIREGYSGLKAGLVGSPEQTRTVTSPSGQTTTEVTQQASSGALGRAGEINLRESAPARAYREVESWFDSSSAPSGNARGGAIRPGLSVGGLPYSQATDEYVPEDVSKPFTPGKLEAPKPGGGQQSNDGKQLLDFAKTAAAIYGAGAATGGAIRRHYEDGGFADIGNDGGFGGENYEGGLNPQKFEAPDSSPSSILKQKTDAGEKKGVQSAQINPGVLSPSAGGHYDPSKDDAQTAATLAAYAAVLAFSDRRLKDNIEPIGKLFDGQNVYRYNFKGDDKKQIGLMAQEVEKKYPDAVGLAPRKGFTRGGGLNIPEAYQTMVDEIARERGIPSHLLGAALQVESGWNPDATGRSGEIGLGQILPSTARDPGYGLPPVSDVELRDPRRNIDFAARYIAARNPNVDWSNPVTAARALTTNYNAGGDPNYGERIIRLLPNVTEEQIAEVRANQPNARVSTAQEGGLAPPERRQQAAPEEKDWLRDRFNKNEYWLVPLLTGLGTMASSPSRYLGSAVLQGLMGAGQAYQQTLGAEGMRAKTAEETKKIAEEAELTRQRQQLTGASTQQILSGIAAGAEDPNRRTVRIFRNGRYTLIPREEFYNNPAEYQLYLAPYSAEERARLQTPPSREPAPSVAPGTPSREPGAPSSEPGAPAGGGQPAPDGSRPDAAPVPPPTVPTTRSTDPVALVTSLPEETRNLADQEIRVARGQSTTDLRAAAGNIPSSQDVFTTARTRASAAAGSLPDRLNLAKEFMALPDEGIGSLGRANVFLTPMLSWANSTLRLFNVQDRDGNLVQLNPRQLAGLEAIDKETIQSALNRQGLSGSRAFAELNAILSATPNTQMTRETVQKILAGNFVEEQRAIDLDNFTNLWRNYALQGRENAVGVSPDELRLTGPQVEREFNRLYPPAQYSREKAGIEKILDSRVGGRPLIDLIIESRGEPSQPMIEYMNNNFANEGGARLLRHFYGR
jgi:hypothetical protein